MENIDKIILVMSGKGGVGKSTIASNLAVWLSMQGKKTGLLDIDIHGPSVPKLLNLESELIKGKDNKIEPVRYRDTLSLMSIGFLLPDDSSPVIWRGPMKHNLINQFTQDVKWGRLDYLIVDCPPGTGDEPLSIVQSIRDIDGAIVVTTPQQLSVIDVKKCISFCRQLNLPVLGIIENMSGFICPECNKKIEIFKGQGGREIADKFDVPFLGKIPLGAEAVTSCDEGKPIVQFDKESQISQALSSAFESLIEINKDKENEKEIKV
ncbi:MAG: Mrp/NBP35 family ATP-binding protein [Sedimentisphaerales bacterium]|jgi:ATP-binding protein involved in chromosome partitioning